MDTSKKLKRTFGLLFAFCISPVFLCSCGVKEIRSDDSYLSEATNLGPQLPVSTPKIVEQLKGDELIFKSLAVSGEFKKLDTGEMTTIKTIGRLSCKKLTSSEIKNSVESKGSGHTQDFKDNTDNGKFTCAFQANEEEGFNVSDRDLYEKLDCPEEMTEYHHGTHQFQKTLGDLSCTRTEHSEKHVTVGFNCSYEKAIEKTDEKAVLDNATQSGPQSNSNVASERSASVEKNIASEDSSNSTISSVLPKIQGEQKEQESIEQSIQQSIEQPLERRPTQTEAPTNSQ